MQGFGIEVNPSNQIIWKYKSPVTSVGIVGRTDPTTNANYVARPIFRMSKYPLNYPAFSGRILVPQEPVEGAPFASCDLVTGLEDKPLSTISYPNPVDERLTVTSPGKFSATLVDGQGKKLFEGQGEDTLFINTASMPAGLYLLQVGKRVEKILVRH